MLFRVIQTKLLQEPVLAQCAPPLNGKNPLSSLWTRPLFCIGNTEKQMSEDKRQQIQIQKSTSLGRLKIEGYKPPAELTSKAVSRGHHLSGPMLVTAKIHPILLSKNKSCRFEIYALVVKWTNSYIIWSILWVQRDRQISSHQTNTRNDEKKSHVFGQLLRQFPRHCFCISQKASVLFCWLQ